MTDEDLDKGLLALTWGGNAIPLGRIQDFKCVSCGCDLLKSIEYYARFATRSSGATDRRGAHGPSV
jgi:hypothetical protein